MKEEIYKVIKILLLHDETLGPDDRQAILKVCRYPKTASRRKLITVRQAAEIIGCHPKTVQRYERQGVINAIRLSKRKVRYVKQEIEEFAFKGINI